MVLRLVFADNGIDSRLPRFLCVQKRLFRAKGPSTELCFGAKLVNHLDIITALDLKNRVVQARRNLRQPHMNFKTTMREYSMHGSPAKMIREFG